MKKSDWFYDVIGGGTILMLLLASLMDQLKPSTKDQSEDQSYCEAFWEERDHNTVEAKVCSTDPDPAVQMPHWQ